MYLFPKLEFEFDKSGSSRLIICALFFLSQIFAGVFFI